MFASNVNGYHGDCAAHRVCSFRRGFHRGTQQHLVMNWKEIKKNIYYTKDDYIRDVISFDLHNGAFRSIYDYISKDTLFHINDKINYERLSNTTATILFKEVPLIRWYLNNENILEMDIDARFVNRESVHFCICNFFANIANLLSNKIYIVDDIIRTQSLVLMEFIPNKIPKVLEQVKYLNG